MRIACSGIGLRYFLTSSCSRYGAIYGVGSQKVLVVDDDHAVLDLIAEVLLALGCEVLLAIITAHAALESAIEAI